MLLAIDSGNTNIVFAVYDGETRLGLWRAATAQARTADDHAVWLSSLMRMHDLEPNQITDTIICSVVPHALFELKQLCRGFFGCEPVIVSQNLDLGIKILIDNPGSAGADRLANAVGVNKTYGGPAIVLDFGTGTTFDVVDRSGNYCGGVIAPGINLSLKALHDAAAHLPRIDVARPNKVIGGGTVEAMQSGVYWGYLGLIEGLVSRIATEFGSPMKVIATGGLAPVFAGATDAITEVDPDITLTGIVEIWKRAKGTP
ncbi:MAG: type III pantothenate kinase [Alphaproteobacteria bacterium]